MAHSLRFLEGAHITYTASFILGAAVTFGCGEIGSTAADAADAAAGGATGTGGNGQPAGSGGSAGSSATSKFKEDNRPSAATPRSRNFMGNIEVGVSRDRGRGRGCAETSHASARFKPRAAEDAANGRFALKLLCRAR